MNTGLFQVSSWFLLNNDSIMASALGKRCSIFLLKKEKWKLKKLKWYRSLPLATLLYDPCLDACGLSDYKYYKSHVFHNLGLSILQSIYNFANNEIISNSVNHRQESWERKSLPLANSYMKAWRKGWHVSSS